MIEYPSSFPRSARNRVETAIAKAELDYAANRITLVNFVLGIFEHFLWDFTKIVFDQQSERLSAEIFRRDTRRFLDCLIEQTHADKPSSEPDKLKPFVSHPSLNEDLETFRARILREVAQYPFWADHQKNIQALSVDDGEASDASATGGEMVESAPWRNPQVTWEQVTMRFANKRTVQVTIGDDLQPPQSYEDLGFANRKTNQPISAWKALQEFARRDGTVDSMKSVQWARDWPAFKKRTEELRQILKRHFKIEGNPVPFVNKIGYRTAFKIDPGSTFDL